MTRKGRPFIWGNEQQGSFEEIKHRLIEPPVLHMPNTTGRFHLYSDTNKFATGSALNQIQNNKPKLIVCASKRLPEVTKNYTITEQELCGLAINIASFSHLLKRVEAWYSLEQYIGLKEDKLSSTTVDFIRSEGNLETKCLYWFSKPKMC